MNLLTTIGIAPIHKGFGTRRTHIGNDLILQDMNLLRDIGTKCYFIDVWHNGIRSEIMVNIDYAKKKHTYMEYRQARQFADAFAYTQRIIQQHNTSRML